MIHRAVLGSLERFFGILIENYAGDFPLWLAPTQARILPVTNNEVCCIDFVLLSRVVKLTLLLSYYIYAKHQ
jgi:threonyl-tRNA synthetase